MPRGSRGRQSLNGSVTLRNNTSIILDESRNETFEFEEFVKRFEELNPDKKPEVELIGYEKTINLIKTQIEALLSRKKRSQDFILILGPSGTGKTTVINKLAKDYSAKLKYFYLPAPMMIEKKFGNPEETIRKIFLEAEQNAPSLIFIDEIESICADKRSQLDTGRIYNVLKQMLKVLKTRSSQVLVMAATDRPENLGPEIRKTCYFEKEIKFTLPSREDRINYLKHITQDECNIITPEQIEQIADATKHYSFLNLDRLHNEAINLSIMDGEKLISHKHLKSALDQYKPGTIKSIATECPPLKWSNIGGNEFAKKELQESVIWPLRHRKPFERRGISSNKGVLLYGPPGCSKTMLAQALATESGYNFISIKGPELFSKYVGDSEAAVRKLYRNARDIAPCIIFFDEIDGLAAERNDSSSVGEKVVTQLLTELNGITPLEDVFTIAATNRPDRLDKALLRPGRLDPAIYIPLPDESNRIEIFRVHMQPPLPLKFGEESFEDVIKKLASLTEGYSGAEIAKICRLANVISFRESLESSLGDSVSSNADDSITWRHFEEALAKVEPGTDAEQLKAYEQFRQRSKVL